MSIADEKYIGELDIDEAFSSLAPALTDEERKLLEESILENGCRDALIAWEHDGKVILVDGHNRREICTEVGVGFRVRKQVFADREAVVKFIVDNQLARRNLTEEQKSALRGRRYISEKSGRGGDRKSKGQVGPLIGKSTADKLAEEFDVSANTIKRDAAFIMAVDSIAAADPAAKPILLAGDVKLPAKAAGAILGMEPDQVAEVARAVAEKSVKSVADVIVARPKMHPCPRIPAAMKPAFDKQHDFRAIVQQLGKTLTAIEALRNTPAGVFLAERFPSIKADIQNAKRAVKFSMPARVCPYCSGAGCPREGANKSPCRETGWVHKGMKGPGK